MNGWSFWLDWANRKLNKLIIRAMVIAGVSEEAINQTIKNMQERQKIVSQSDKDLRMKFYATKILIISLIIAAIYFVYVKFIKPRIKK